MKNIILITVFGLLISNLFSQSYEIIDNDTVNRLDINGLKHGKWITFIDGLKKVENYNNNRLNGKSQLFDDKKVLQEITHKNGLRNGNYIEYTSSDTINILSYKNDSLIWEKTFWTDNKIHSMTHYVNDIPHGIQILYNYNGSINTERIWNKGNIEQVKTYYDNGKLNNEFYSKPNTIDIYYYKTGKIKQKKTDFEIIDYNKKGKITNVEKLKPDILNGNDTIKGFCNKERILKKGKKNYYIVQPFYNGVEHGTTKVFYPKGSIYFEGYSEYGRCKRMIYYYKSGVIKSIIEIDINDTMHTKNYNKKGILIKEYDFNYKKNMF